MTRPGTAAWSIQIMQAVWAPPAGPAPASCRDGLRQLLEAIERRGEPAGREKVGEREALRLFRESLLPAWALRAELGRLCRSPEEEAMLKAIDGLRYAEEHAVRYEATALATQRAEARALADKLRDPPKHHD
jgi:hypothetical protein